MINLSDLEKVFILILSSFYFYFVIIIKVTF